MKYLVFFAAFVAAFATNAQKTIGALESIAIDSDSITICGRITDAPFDYEGDATVTKVIRGERTIWNIQNAQGDVIFKTVTFSYTPLADTSFDLMDEGLTWVGDLTPPSTQYATSNAFVWEVKANDYEDGTGSLMFAYGVQGETRFTRLFYLWVDFK